MLKEDLSKYLKFINESSTHLLYRCPFCGDSSKSLKKGHLYISKKSPVFRCVKCEKAGHLSYLISFLKADIVIPEFLDKGNITKRLANDVNLNINVDKLEDNVLSYLENRLGIFSDVYLKELNILTMSEYKKIIKNLNKDTDNNYPVLEGVPFVTFKNRKIIHRVIDSKYHLRYFNYNLINEKDYYIIKNKRDYRNYIKHKTVVVGEGVFDVINCYIKNILDLPNDTIYVSSGSKEFSNAIKEARGIALTYNPNIIVLADNDVEDKFYLNRLKQYKNIKIYRNKMGKDFGERNVEPSLSYNWGKL